MTLQMTQAAQETTVGEGLAIAARILGVRAITADKLTIELAFGKAWRGWDKAVTFPGIHADLARNDLLRILRKSAGRRWGQAAWRCGQTYEPYLISDWTLEEAGEYLAEDSGIALESWLVLSEAFLHGIGEPGLVRET